MTERKCSTVGRRHTVTASSCTLVVPHHTRLLHDASDPADEWLTWDVASYEQGGAVSNTGGILNVVSSTFSSHSPVGGTCGDAGVTLCSLTDGRHACGCLCGPTLVRCRG